MNEVDAEASHEHALDMSTQVLRNILLLSVSLARLLADDGQLVLSFLLCFILVAEDDHLILSLLHSLSQVLRGAVVVLLLFVVVVGVVVVGVVVGVVVDVDVDVSVFGGVIAGGGDVHDVGDGVVGDAVGGGGVVVAVVVVN